MSINSTLIKPANIPQDVWEQVCGEHGFNISPNRISCDCGWKWEPSTDSPTWQRQHSSEKALQLELRGYEHRTEQARLRKPKIVCICGSTRFEKQIKYAAEQYTMRGWIVVMPHVLTTALSASYSGIAESIKANLDQLHKRKIDICDEVFIVNDEGYIGLSTQREIEYATSLQKPIKYMWSGLNSQFTRSEILDEVKQMLLESRLVIEGLLEEPIHHQDDTARGAMKTVRGIENLISRLNGMYGTSSGGYRWPAETSRTIMPDNIR